jgi:hypothetical protein
MHFWTRATLLRPGTKNRPTINPDPYGLMQRIHAGIILTVLLANGLMGVVLFSALRSFRDGLRKSEAAQKEEIRHVYFQIALIQAQVETASSLLNITVKDPLTQFEARSTKNLPKSYAEIGDEPLGKTYMKMYAKVVDRRQDRNQNAGNPHGISAAIEVQQAIANEILNVSRAIIRTLPSNSVENPNILAFSLYGSNERYTMGAIANSILYKKVYPGWSMRVYHDNSVPLSIVKQLHENGVVLVNMSSSPLLVKTTWRFAVASDKNVSRFCSRDTDSRLSPREKAAVDAWIVSKKKFHVMRDHPSHSRQHAMLAGMWCATGDAIPDMIERLQSRKLRDYFFQDQDFLSEAVWPIARTSVIHHDSFSCEKHENAFPFPLRRVGFEHVGGVFIDGQLRQSDVDVLKAATPPRACLPE